MGDFNMHPNRWFCKVIVILGVLWGGISGAMDRNLRVSHRNQDEAFNNAWGLPPSRTSSTPALNQLGFFPLRNQEPEKNSVQESKKTPAVDPKKLEGLRKTLLSLIELYIQTRANCLNVLVEDPLLVDSSANYAGLNPDLAAAARTINSYTPLYLAVKYFSKTPKFVKTVLLTNASPDIAKHENDLPYYIASDCATAKLLLSYSKKQKKYQYEFIRLLAQERAMPQQERSEYLSYLIKEGNIDPNQATERYSMELQDCIMVNSRVAHQMPPVGIDPFLPLHKAIYNNDKEGITVLMRHGADPNKKGWGDPDIEEQSAYALAATLKRDNFVKIMKKERQQYIKSTLLQDSCKDPKSSFLAKLPEVLIDQIALYVPIEANSSNN